MDVGNRLKDIGLKVGEGHHFLTLPLADEETDEIHFIEFPFSMVCIRKVLPIHTIFWLILSSFTR